MYRQHLVYRVLLVVSRESLRGTYPQRLAKRLKMRWLWHSRVGTFETVGRLPVGMDEIEHAAGDLLVSGSRMVAIRSRCTRALRVAKLARGIPYT
jgi:hypothetical protein